MSQEEVTIEITTTEVVLDPIVTETVTVEIKATGPQGIQGDKGDQGDKGARETHKPPFPVVPCIASKNSRASS